MERDKLSSMAEGSGVPQKQEVEEKEQRLRQSIAQNYTHIKAVENQLAELQLQLNLTSGPKKSALEMLRKKIEAKNELVAAARQKFAAAAKIAEAAEQELRAHERSKEQLCQELNLLVHQSATAELNKLEQLTKQLDNLNGGKLSKSDGQETVMKQALAHQLTVTHNLPSAEDAAAATTEQQARASTPISLPPSRPSTPSPAQTGLSPDSSAQQASAQESGSTAAAETGQGRRGQPMSGQPAMQNAPGPTKNRSHQNRKQIPRGAQKDPLPQAATDSAGRFKGFE